MKNRGFTLIEVLLAMFIVVAAVGALALIYPGMLTGVTLDSNSLRAWLIAKQEIEALRNSNFDTLYSVSYSPGTTPVVNTFTTGIANTTGFYYVERMRDSTNAILTDLVKLEVMVCFRSGNRIVGEDQNLNGTLDSGEDINSDQKVSSGVRLSALNLKP